MRSVAQLPRPHDGRTPLLALTRASRSEPDNRCVLRARPSGYQGG